jgi:hypothetical protein
MVMAAVILQEDVGKIGGLLITAGTIVITL